MYTTNLFNHNKLAHLLTVYVHDWIYETPANLFPLLLSCFNIIVTLLLSVFLIQTAEQFVQIKVCNRIPVVALQKGIPEICS